MDLNKNQLNMKKLILIISCLLSTFVINAQFTKLHDYDLTAIGSNLQAAVVSDGTFLYGLTSYGGSTNNGTIFKIKPDGTGYATLFNFDSITTGSNPQGSLVYDGAFLYGVTQAGGANDSGTVFKIQPDGTNFTTLLNFNAITGGNPHAVSLVSDGSFLYGMTTDGGANGDGTIFKIQPDGTAVTKLFDFDSTITGNHPLGSLVSSGDFLYGITNAGGTDTIGTLFKIKSDGTEFTKLIDFDYVISGGRPSGSLTSDGTFLYGMTVDGGAYAKGTIYKINSDGTGFSTMIDFNGYGSGSNPDGALIFDGTFLYGTASLGGIYNYGTIFKMKPDGTEFLNLYNFNNTLTGWLPHGSLYFDGVFLYGATTWGGDSPVDGSVLFKIKSDGTAYSDLFSCNSVINGGGPQGTLFSDGTFLYGTTSGGISSFGTIFKMKPDGTSYTKLFDFNDRYVGVGPLGSFISDGTFLYGTTSGGGANSAGTIYKIMPDGSGYTKLFDFDYSTGGDPADALFFDGSSLYGTTKVSGGYGDGTLFKIQPDGSGFTKLLDFGGATSGQNPVGPLISDGTFLYGMTMFGGSHGLGTMFKIKPDGTEYATMLDFGDTTNGSIPFGSLISDGTFFYGTTGVGGLYGVGTIFKIKPDGSEYTKFFDFDTTTAIETGLAPNSSLVSDGTFLYGINRAGGTYQNGTIFKIKTDGTGFEKLLDFENVETGNNPQGSLILDDTFLYGTAWLGGSDNFGVIFKMSKTLPSCIANYTTVYDSASDNYMLTVDSAATEDVTSYNWDFGDGSTSSLAVPTHTFVTTGSYNVCMNIHRIYGDSCSYCQVLTGDAGFTINIPDSTATPPCIASYTTDYDSTLNAFILNVDSTTTALATSYHWDFGRWKYVNTCYTISRVCS